MNGPIVQGTPASQDDAFCTEGLHLAEHMRDEWCPSYLSCLDFPVDMFPSHPEAQAR